MGTALDITHLAATPLGMEVKATAEVITAEGNKIVFEVWAVDDKDDIAKGTHTRFVVDQSPFQERADAKAN